MSNFLDENKTLSFTFSENQNVLQYDSSSFYRNKLLKFNESTGIKAVDFLCCDDSQNVSFLIEVKNFRKLIGEEAKNHKKAEVAENWAKEVAQKIFDTISGLFVATFSAQCCSEEQRFAQQFLAHPLRIVFHYELPAKWSDDLRKQRMADMKQRLKRKLQVVDPQLRVEDTSMARYWTVTRIGE